MKPYITIARKQGGPQTGFIEISINDNETKTFIRIQMNPQDFGNAITGLVTDCEYQIQQGL